MTIEMRHLFDLSMTLHPTIEMGETPAGARRIFAVSGGTFRGDRLAGTISPMVGSDLLLGRPDGTFQQDVRMLLITDDDVPILMTYRGIRRASPEVDARLARGEPVSPSEYYLRTTPYFETTSGKYGWINGVVAVATGGRVPEGVRYQVYELL